MHIQSVFKKMVQAKKNLVMKFAKKYVYLVPYQSGIIALSVAF